MGFIWIITVILGLLVLYLGVGFYAAQTMTRVGDHPQFAHTPADYGSAYCVVRFAARGDRLTLAGWYLANPGAGNALVLVHGRNASKQNAISGRMPELAAALHHSGFAVLVIDLRGHGESEGKRFYWGVRERRDVLGAVDYLQEQGFAVKHIGLLGISLGGAAVIGATATEPSLRTLVVDSTFADLDALISANWRGESGLPDCFLPGVYLAWRVLYGFDLKGVKPADEIARCGPLSVLILHSHSDAVVDVSHAQQLQAAIPGSELVIFPKGDHAELYRDHPVEYLEAVLESFQKHSREGER